jgi:uncharacterized protein (TIGR03032 family)
MKRYSVKKDLKELWNRHDSEWRDPFQVVAQWQNDESIDPRLLEYTVTGNWWQILEETLSTLIVTREYEHLALAISVLNGKPLISYLQLPHPSGIAVSIKEKKVFIASTRNPNLIFDFSPVSEYINRHEVTITPQEKEYYLTSLIPKCIRFYPGCFYIHDLGMIDGKLYASSVGQNAIVHLADDGHFERVWWPRCIEKQGKPTFDSNYIQLNSIAAGSTVSGSCFTASASTISAYRPGHKKFLVDRCGVIFSGETREPLVSGLTRPHSARFHQGRLFVDDSGYGKLVAVDEAGIETIACLPGWTRGLTFHNNIAFVGTSHVIPKFHFYAPGLDVNKSECGIHAVDLTTGQILGSLYWPFGNQIFAIELVPRDFTSGFPLKLGRKRSSDRERKLFYLFQNGN